MNILNKVVGIVSLVVTLVPLPARAEWVPVSISRVNTTFYVDTSSIRYSGNHVAFWQRSIPFNPANPSHQELKVTDCSTGNWLIQERIVFSGDKVLSHLTYKPKLTSVHNLIPGSTGEEIYDFVCH